MYIFFGILLLLACAAFVRVLLGNTRTGSSKNSAAKQRSADVRAGKTEKDRLQPQKFNAISIIPGLECCQAANDAKDKRVLVDEAEHLPLKDCDQIASCQCAYKHHSDRRSEDDRRNLVGSLSTAINLGNDVTNQRSGRDRRAD
jgi:hypothetical protein